MFSYLFKLCNSPDTKRIFITPYFCMKTPVFRGFLKNIYDFIKFRIDFYIFRSCNDGGESAIAESIKSLAIASSNSGSK